MSCYDLQYIDLAKELSSQSYVESAKQASIYTGHCQKLALKPIEIKHTELSELHQAYVIWTQVASRVEFAVVLQKTKAQIRFKAYLAQQYAPQEKQFLKKEETKSTSDQLVKQWQELKRETFSRIDIVTPIVIYLDLEFDMAKA